MSNSTNISPKLEISEGGFKPLGYDGGLFTEVLLNTATWTKLPATTLVGRQAMSIQNPASTGVEVKVNYDNTEPGYKGTAVVSGSERFYQISDAGSIYAKAAIGTPTIVVEELKVS